jgi:hypothetical protein
MKRAVAFALAVAFVFVLGACAGESADPLIGIRASTDPAIGDSRLLFAVNEIDGTRRGSPDEKVSVVASPLDDPDRTIAADADFIWIIPDSIGLYKADVAFDQAGVWQIDFSISTGEETDPFLIDIKESPSSVGIGDPAPRIKTPTVADVPLEDLTTDTSPFEALYTLSLDEALDNGRKTVALFASPGFCVSATCGPLVNQTKEFAAAWPDVDFIHVEVYVGFNEPGFAPDGDHLAPAVGAFRLPSEPWMFVMDEAGVVLARFEGVLAPGELDAVLGSG